jgi:hypothetical protein
MGTVEGHAMSARVNHPLKSLFHFVLLAALAWGAYEFVYKRRIFQPAEAAQPFGSDRADEMRDTILKVFGEHDCLLEVRSIILRHRDNIYRIEIQLADGCTPEARDLCRSISRLMDEELDLKAQVWAYDVVGVELAHHVP